MSDRFRNGIELLDRCDRTIPKRRHRLSFARNSNGGIRINGNLRTKMRELDSERSTLFDFDIPSTDVEALRDFLIDACSRKKLRNA